MVRLPCCSPQHIEAACKVLADTHQGLTGTQIGQILRDMNTADVSADMTKWKRLYNALIHAQNAHQVGNRLVMFITRAMNPVNYSRDREAFEWLRDELNVVWRSPATTCVMTAKSLAQARRQLSPTLGRARGE
jgi:hypothetical protein